MASELKDQNRHPRNKPYNLCSNYSQKYQESYNEKRKVSSVTSVENIEYLYVELWRQLSYPLPQNSLNMNWWLELWKLVKNNFLTYDLKS